MESVSAEIQNEILAAGAQVRLDRAGGLQELNEIFRGGWIPDPPLDGRYQGGLAALDLAPGLTQAFRALTDVWLPWRGKAFIARKALGNNIFTRESKPVGRFLWPLYRGYIQDGPTLFRAFEFRTYKADGLMDTDLQVLKIDYDHAGNPALFIRQILDELIQVAEGFYLGKAHLRWWWGRWQTVAYFTLASASDHTDQTRN
jgi:hypothetical protein